ncbi:MAG: hypothetical protein RLY23_1793, partial [Actinomycetota bacterium]
GADDYDSMIETIAVLSDGDLLKDHLRGLEESSTGDVLDAESLLKLLGSRGPQFG